MNIALLSDTHYGIHKNSEVFLNSQIKFIKTQFVPYLKNNDIQNIFWLGDMWDNRSSINIKVQNVVYDLFKNELSKFNIYLIVGNHDCFYNSDISVNSLKMFSEFENVHLIEKITKVKIFDTDIVMVPWVIDQLEFAKEFRKNPCDLCFGHFNIQGFHYNKFKTSDDGFETKLFGRCKKVFSGHFHIRNTQMIQGCEIVYIGSPYQLTRNDMDEERGFTILNLEDLSYKYINNEKSLKYIKLSYPDNFSQKTIEGNVIDVHVKYDDVYDENQIDKYIKKIEQFNPILPPNIFVNSDSQITGDIDLTNCNIGSMKDLMREYLKSLEIDNKEEIYELLIDLYNQTKNDNI